MYWYIYSFLHVNQVFLLIIILIWDYGFSGGVVGVVRDVGELLERNGCCRGRNAEPLLGFSWNDTHGFEQ